MPMPRLTAADRRALEKHYEWLQDIGQKFAVVERGLRNAIWNEETGELEFPYTERGERRSKMVLTKII